MVPGWRQGKKKDDLHIVFAPGKLVFQHTYTDRGPFRVVFLIRHTALSKKVFASGAVTAAKYLVDQAPGLYNMEMLIDN